MVTGLAATSRILGRDGIELDDARSLRLHQNESPYGAPAGAVRAAVAELTARHAHYPDPTCTALSRRIAEAMSVPPDMVAVGNGVDELIHLLGLSLAGPDGPRARIAVTERTFPGYAAATAVAREEMVPVPLVDDRVSADAVVAAFRAGATAAFICNPHNPSGTVLEPTDLAAVIDGAQATSAVVIVDEAYIEFARPRREVAVEAVRNGGPVVVLRTFSKAWGLAALRSGYAIGPAELMGRVRRTRQATPFSVNRMAQCAAVAALDEPEFVDEVRRRTAAARGRLCRALTGLGVEYVPSDANFVLLRLATPGTPVADRLETEHRVFVRDLTPLGMPDCIRVTVGTETDVDRFCDALRAVLARSPGADADG